VKNPAVRAEAAPIVSAVPPPAGAGDVHWYKDAIVYELHVKAFYDSNGDGIGDLRGLTEKLDYLADLGVNTLWLLPFYPSPFRDDGYDVADYHNVHPAYGTRQDFRVFVREAHRRGLRVITELVINHTSDQHPWFQAARRAPKGSDKRDFYVWSDDPNKYAGTRIIFTDTEKSNWSWDEIAGQYYWHRFFHHQPDLNFDNPRVRQAVFRTLRFWLDMGVDGVRLDAIPYLIERDGTTNENLQETHAVIRELRRKLDERYSDKMFLAEANMWPEDVREYFGDGDECHMAYHFPLMPRMFMAIAMEDRHPIVDILQQTPEIPDSCQWAIFLRNHDELTLEMVTNRERDYMWNMYAAEQRARINLGIRRRLAPLMENDRDRVKLMKSLVMSMPGSPILYYGDEIGMGDNIFLGDRDGVRTPMQWTSDRNGGFSRADPQRLYLPPIQDSVYGYEAINVEAQLRAPSSLLNWTRRLLAERKSAAAFGRGKFTLLHPGNRKILAYLREYGDEIILCVANVSRSAQPVELDLAHLQGRVPVEMLGRSAFPPIGELPYMLTLPAHGFYWFRLTRDTPAPKWHVERGVRPELPVLVLFDGLNSFYRDRVVPWRIGMAERTRQQVETTILPEFLAQQRWFATKGEAIARVQLLDDATLEHKGERWLLAIGEVTGPAETVRYFLPFGLVWEEQDEARMRRLAAAQIAKTRQQAQVGALVDSSADALLCQAIVQAIGARRDLPTRDGSLHFVPTAAYGEIVGDAGGEPLPVRPLAMSSNSVVLLGDRLFLKYIRRVRDGINPELEIGRYLTDVAKFAHCVPVAGSVELRRRGGNVAALALLQKFVVNQGDAWTYTVDYLRRHLEAERDVKDHEPADAHGAYLTRVRKLGERTAQLHAAFALRSGDPAFDPEPMTAADVEQWSGDLRRESDATLRLVVERASDIPLPLQPRARELLEAAPRMTRHVERCAQIPPQGLRTRLHGDYHLGQVLVVLNDFVIIDFEGEPTRPLAERRAKHSALRDVAGMLRSFNYARHAAVLEAARAPDEAERLEAVVRGWELATREAFVDAYAAEAVAQGLYADRAQFAATRALREMFELDKALYELRYELQNRPDWVAVPLAGIAALIPPVDGT
jgi:maltose alpha-D-glucosyltransferase/alpha-amylase